MGMTLAGQSMSAGWNSGKSEGVASGRVVRYLQACKVPVGKFMLELAQSGAFGEAEQGLTID